MAKGRHGIHSPFVYQLVDQIFPRWKSFVNPQIEKKLTNFKRDKNIVDVVDFKTGRQNQIPIDTIAKQSISTKKFRSTLSSIASSLNVSTVLEAGTSLGISSAYLCQVDSIANVHTIDGNESIINLAKTEFGTIEKLHFHVGEVKEIFQGLVSEINPDMIFLDADHRGETLDFYMNCLQPHLPKIKLIVVHDIYWSPDMYTAWKKIHHSYPITIDIFEAGLLFPQIQSPPQHFYLKF